MTKLVSTPEPSHALRELIERFTNHSRVQNFASSTITLRRQYLIRFATWCEERGVTQIDEITRDILQAYQRYLFHYRNPRTGRPLKFSTQLSLLVPIRAWFRYLLRERIFANNPASDWDLPKEEQRLPNHVLSVEEVERILSQPDVTTPLGLRDRATLELFYSTAMRRSELIQLDVYDIDLAERLVKIRHGKGRKPRNVPLGKRAARWLKKYLVDVRPMLVERTNSSRLFVSCNGRPLTSSNLSLQVRGFIERAGLCVTGSCHLIRHTVATRMLENGADLRAIQALLGHSNITTTQIYTHVSIKHLRDVHDATHPADQPRRKPRQDGDEK